jgi:hypothetical protein
MCWLYVNSRHWRTLNRQQRVVKINRQNRWNFMERSAYCDKYNQPFLFLFLESCISLIYAWKPTNAPIIHAIYWLCMVDPTCFGITSPSSGSAPSTIWEMLNWGAVDRILWMGVLCLVTRCVAIHATRHNTPIHSILSTVPQLNISQKTLRTLTEDDKVMPKHVGATIHN